MNGCDDLTLQRQWMSMTQIRWWWQCHWHSLASTPVPRRRKCSSVPSSGFTSSTFRTAQLWVVCEHRHDMSYSKIIWANIMRFGWPTYFWTLCRMTLHVAALLFPGWLLRHELKVSSATIVILRSDVYSSWHWQQRSEILPSLQRNWWVGTSMTWRRWHQ